MAAKQILVVDDEKDIAETIQQILEKKPDRACFLASSAAEAYTRAQNQKFDLVITDFRMPKTDGIELAKSIRSIKANMTVPVVIVSGFPDEATVKLGNLANVHFLNKPFMPADLESITEELLNLPSAQPMVQKKKVQVDAKLINHFINATYHTVKTMGGVPDIKAERPKVLKKGERVETDISGFVTMNSNVFSGSLVVSFPEKTYLNLYNNMLGEAHTEINIEIENGAGELINVIYGQTRKTLSAEGYTFDPCLPSIITGKNHRVANMDNCPSLCILFNAGIGMFYVIVSIDNSEPAAAAA